LTNIPRSRHPISRQKNKKKDKTENTITQQNVQREDNQSDVVERGGGEEVVVMEICRKEDPIASTAAEDLLEVQPTRPKRQKKLKLERRESPPRERSRSRVRSVVGKV